MICYTLQRKTRKGNWKRIKGLTYAEKLSAKQAAGRINSLCTIEVRVKKVRP